MWYSPVSVEIAGVTVSVEQEKTNSGEIIQHTITDVASLIADNHPERMSIAIVNIGNENVYMDFISSVSAASHIITPGNSTGNDNHTGQVWCVCAAGKTSKVTTIEFPHS